MIDLKIQPVSYVLQSIHPNLYRIDNLGEQVGNLFTPHLVLPYWLLCFFHQNSADFEGNVVPQPYQLPLSAESINREGVYLLDTGWYFYLYISPHASKEFLKDVMGVNQFSDIEQPLVSGDFSVSQYSLHILSFLFLRKLRTNFVVITSWFVVFCNYLFKESLQSSSDGIFGSHFDCDSLRQPDDVRSSLVSRVLSFLYRART